MEDRDDYDFVGSLAKKDRIRICLDSGLPDIAVDFGEHVRPLEDLLERLANFRDEIFAQSNALLRIPVDRVVVLRAGFRQHSNGAVHFRIRDRASASATSYAIAASGFASWADRRRSIS